MVTSTTASPKVFKPVEHDRRRKVLRSDPPVADRKTRAASVDRTEDSRITAAPVRKAEKEHWCVLVVDGDPLLAESLETLPISGEGQVLHAATVAEGLRLLPRDHAPDLLLLDVHAAGLPGLDGFQVFRQRCPELPIACISSRDDCEAAITATMLGALDFLSKPLQPAMVAALLERARRIRRGFQSASGLPLPEGIQTSRRLIGRSVAMQEVYKTIGRVAAQDITVLIQGESGTGKELVATALHQHSMRAEKPFLAINCAAIPETLLESELFGHEAGSFTGASHRRIGKFEQCTGGTLFLDEIGELTPYVQSKLLRVLQEQQFERVGGNETIHTDVRIIAATNRDLEQEVTRGVYRPDLFYRLNGFTINIPPLRERPEDIPLLLQHYLARGRDEMHKDVRGISPESVELLMRHDWPGNVRELQSLVAQALLNMSGSILLPDDFPLTIRKHSGAVPEEGEGDLRQFVRERLQANSRNLYAETVEQMERHVLARVLQLTSGNQSRSAKILGISRGNLRKKMKEMGLS